MSSEDDQLDNDYDYYNGGKSSSSSFASSLAFKEGLRKSKRKQAFVQGASCDPQPESTRTNRRKVRVNFESICPVCQLTLRSGDVEAHFKYELEKLSKPRSFRASKKSLPLPQGPNYFPSVTPNSIGSDSSQYSELDEEKSLVSELGSGDTLRNQRVRANSTDSNAASEYCSLLNNCASSSTSYPENGPSTSSFSISSSSLAKRSQFTEPGEESYKRVKVNRFLRLQTRRWKLKDMTDEVICPVCGESVPAEIPEDLERHVEKCLRKQDGEESEEEVDVEGDEYEWCGLRKVRLTSLLRSQGQLDALGTLVEKGNEDANVEVCLLHEEEEQFGPPQYFQEDLTVPSPGASSDDEVEVDDPSTSDSPFPSLPDHCYGPSSSDAKNSLGSLEDTEDKGHGDAQARGGTSQSAVMEALQLKIRDLEAKGIFICNICHGPYDVPLTSTVCWHVHCEKCWLLALSTQKLCPQCKVIVSPTELRRVYL